MNTTTWLQPDRRMAREPLSFAVDVLVALLFVWITVESIRSDAYVSEFGPVEGLSWILAISPTLMIPLRRVAPATVLAAATILYLIISAFQGDSNAPLAIPFFAYAVGITRPTAVSGTMVSVAAAAMSATIFYGPGDPLVVALPVNFLLFGVGWLVAVSIRYNQSRAGMLAAEAETLRAEQSIVAEQAAADERARIARELHDAVGHAVNVMVLHAGAARLASTDERAVESLGEIERIGRGALTDLDHMLGLLHDDSVESAPLEPTRTMADIARLIAETRAGGADVRFHNRCPGDGDLATNRPAGAAVYRIVQEALTNALKHAGGAHIEVTVECTENDLVLSVVDDGAAGVAVSGGGGGRGIAGMAERAKVLGGRFRAGSRPEGGFAVEARIPRSAPSVGASPRHERGRAS